MHVYVKFVSLQCDRASCNWWFLFGEFNSHLSYCERQTALYWSRHGWGEERQGRKHCGIDQVSLLWPHFYHLMYVGDKTQFHMFLHRLNCAPKPDWLLLPSAGQQRQSFMWAVHKAFCFSLTQRTSRSQSSSTPHVNKHAHTHWL